MHFALCQLTMKKLKYIAPILILFAVACLGLQQAKADSVTYMLTNVNSPGLGTGPFGTVTVSLTGNTATITFTAAAGYLFVDGQAVDVNVNATSWTVANITSNGNPVSDTGAHNVDGFGSFNQTLSQANSSNGAGLVTFTLTNTTGTWASALQGLIANVDGWLVGAHLQIANGFTAYAVGNTTTLPDGGTTAMLLGAALGALGMARRFTRH